MKCVVNWIPLRILVRSRNTHNSLGTLAKSALFARRYKNMSSVLKATMGIPRGESRMAHGSLVKQRPPIAVCV